MSDNPKQSAEHIFHVWINRYADTESKAGKKRPHSLYEFKSLMQFLEYGHKQLEQAFTGKLRTMHRQCSHQEAEPIPENRLRCCLGTDVTKCEILVSIKTTFDEERNRECGQLGKWYTNVPDEEMYRCMAKTCAWHIYKRATAGTEGFHIDTSEGHLMDESDRMFWERTYANMAMQDPDDEVPDAKVP